MKFSLRQLQVFHQIAELHSVSEAAKSLNMSQSAASMALAQLESQLDKPLFHRQGRKMMLNHWGHWLRPHVNQILMSCSTIEMGMNNLEVISGKLSLGVSQTPAEHIVPALVAELDQDFPQLEMRVHVDNTENVISGLIDYRYDIGLIEGHCDDERLAQVPICDDELVIVASADHPFARQKLTRVSQLEMSSWILREPGAGTRKIFDNSIRKFIDQVKVHREYDHIGVILHMVSQSQYLTCLSYRSVEQAVKQGRLAILNVPELSMKREIRYAWRKNDMESDVRDVIFRTTQALVAS